MALSAEEVEARLRSTVKTCFRNRRSRPCGGASSGTSATRWLTPVGRRVWRLSRRASPGFDHLDLVLVNGVSLSGGNTAPSKP